MEQSNKQSVLQAITKITKNATLPSEFTNDSMLTGYPLFLSAIDMVYLFIVMRETFPNWKIDPKDFVNYRFNSVNNILLALN